MFFISSPAFRVQDSARVKPVGELVWFVDRAAAG